MGKPCAVQQAEIYHLNFRELREQSQLANCASLPCWSLTNQGQNFLWQTLCASIQKEVISQCGHWRLRWLSALRSAGAACFQACSRRSVVIPYNKLELATGQICFFHSSTFLWGLGLWQGCLHPKQYLGTVRNQSRALLLRQISYYH